MPAFQAHFPRGQQNLVFECDLRNTLAREVYFTGQYEPQETALIEALVKPGQTFVDVGAHWGYFSLIASQRTGPSGSVLAIEADPRLFRTLSRNIETNKLKNVEAIQVAAAAGLGSLRMAGYSEAHDSWGVSRLISSEANFVSSDMFDVRTDSIDSLLDERRIKTVDVLKMDIEGAEALALRGMEAGLRIGRYRLMIIEVHPPALVEFNSNIGAITDFLSGLGYRAGKIRHSKRATTKAAYGTVVTRQLLEPWGRDSVADDWPHLLLSLTEPEL